MYSVFACILLSCVVHVHAYTTYNVRHQETTGCQKYVQCTYTYYTVYSHNNIILFSVLYIVAKLDKCILATLTLVWNEKKSP